MLLFSFIIRDIYRLINFNFKDGKTLKLKIKFESNYVIKTVLGIS